MEPSIETKLKLITKYNITAEELFVIDLLFLASAEERHPEYLYEYINSSKIHLRDILFSLREKGIIVKSWKLPDSGSIFDPETVIFNKNFINNYRKYSSELGCEFFQCYPSICIINGVEAPLKNFAKKFNSEEEFYFAYGKSIGWNLDTHKKVLELVQWAKDNNCRLINMNICDFVISKMWQSIQELKDGGGTITFDNMQTI